MIHDFKAIKRLAKIINILYLPTALPCKIAEKRERQNRNTAGTENFCINFVARNVFEKVCKVYKVEEQKLYELYEPYELYKLYEPYKLYTL